MTDTNGLYLKYDESGNLVLPKDPALAFCNVGVDSKDYKKFYISKRYLRFNLTKNRWEESESRVFWTKVVYCDGEWPGYPPVGMVNKIKRFLWRLV